MSSELENEFARALAQAAGSAAGPSPESLYSGAVHRGRRIRRATTIKRTLAGTAALGVAAAVAVPLLTLTQGGQPTTATRTAGVAHPGTTASTPTGTAWMPGYMERTFMSLLPAGTSTAPHGTDGQPLQAFAPQTSLSGVATGTVQADLTTAHGTSAAQLVVRAHKVETTCPAAASAPHDECSTTSVAGGTLTVDKTFKDPRHGTGVSIWNVQWNGPQNQTLSFSETAPDPAHQALTPQQATALVTAPNWARLWQSLPAPCRYGVMKKPHATNARTIDGLALTCATTPADALPTP